MAATAAVTAAGLWYAIPESNAVQAINSVEVKKRPMMGQKTPGGQGHGQASSLPEPVPGP
jgi:hypothetical protein